MAVTKDHWENVYETKDTTKVGWFQEKPIVSLDLIEEFGINKNSAILDVGGGDSLLVDHLLALGYKDISVLDISSTSLKKAKIRLGKNADKIEWIHSDIIDFNPDRKYDVWHDRAVFHFLMDKEKIDIYLKISSLHIKPGGWLFIGVFSETGPETCSGLPVQRYSTVALAETFSMSFDCVKSFNTDHITPSGVTQNYSFCCLKRK
ncbi:class I SAM-dependent methyltransferase [Cecembia calidifontis]|uniref:Methyltransferase family protein n=1 Tax=Cecembia calidifontis TaxID=1187080 RepID=A0A4V2F6Y4_9BACT|nr:class I SAM-dependent methyltransferase [Cecembia calidifontis]RZS97929.1 methyltransferase family protein [Cecembia calidifontis]